jgi:hypothetical protein
MVRAQGSMVSDQGGNNSDRGVVFGGGVLSAIRLPTETIYPDLDPTAYLFADRQPSAIAAGEIEPSCCLDPETSSVVRRT